LKVSAKDGGAGSPTQKLLLPQTFDVPPPMPTGIERNLSILQDGIGIETSGPAHSRSIFSWFLEVSDPAQFMRK